MLIPSPQSGASSSHHGGWTSHPQPSQTFLLRSWSAYHDHSPLLSPHPAHHGGTHANQWGRPHARKTLLRARLALPLHASHYLPSETEADPNVKEQAGRWSWLKGRLNEQQSEEDRLLQSGERRREIWDRRRRVTGQARSCGLPAGGGGRGRRWDF